MRSYLHLPYEARIRRRSGLCRRCGARDVDVIESVDGDFLCWDLGMCFVRRPLPKKGWE